MTSSDKDRRGSSSSYRDVARLFRNYYLSYGGVSSVARSPYAHLSAFVGVISFSIWSRAGWWELPLSILPGLVGFTLAGYAVVMTIGDSRLRLAMMEPLPDRVSAFMAMNATFFHFLLLQLLSILLALVAKARVFSSILGITDLKIGSVSLRFVVTSLGWLISYTLFIYALVSALAAVAAIFRLGSWLEKSGRSHRSGSPSEKD